MNLHKFQSIKDNKYYQTCNVCMCVRVCVCVCVCVFICVSAIWKTQQWPQDWKRSVFIPISKEGDAKVHSNYHTIELISHASKIMLKILHASLQ